jgi:hypothetical protein
MLTAMAVRTCCRRALGCPPVAAVAHAVAAGKLADGALDAGSHGVALVPGGVLLVGAVAGLQLVELARRLGPSGPREWRSPCSGFHWFWACSSA